LFGVALAAVKHGRYIAPMILEIVPIYAALLGIFYLVLSGRAIRARRTARKAIGALGDSALDRHVRVHSNFAEYAPFVLLLLAFAELREAPEGLLHLACVGLVAGRLSHAWGVSKEPENFKFRRYGMMATFFALVVAVALLLASYLVG
jgi:uncharacterized membrane protein YecN with MAPEG domain